MAIVGTNLTTSGSGSGASSYNTASVAPAAGTLILAAFMSNLTTGGANAPTLSGASMTWTSVRAKIDGATQRRVTVFRSLSFAPGSGALTVSFGGQTQTTCGWSIAQFSGVDVSGTNGDTAIVQSADNEVTAGAASTGITVTLGTFQNSQNATYGAIRKGGTNAVTVGSGFTELGQNNTTNTYESEWKNTSDTTVDWSWSSESQVSIAIAIELRAAQGGSFLLNMI